MKKLVVYIHAERSPNWAITASDTHQETLKSLLTVKLSELGFNNPHIEIGVVETNEHNNLT